MRSGYYAVVNLLKSLVAAFQFLTRLPIPIDLFATDTPRRENQMDTVFQRSVIFFPMVGGLIGVIIAALALGLAFLLPTYVNVVILLCVWIFISGGLHLDGLMDSADGLLSHRSPERMLEIMKDSRVGAMGVIVCVIYLMLKAVLLYALLEDTNDGVGNSLLLMAVIPVWSRAFMVTAITGWRYARPGQGLGQLFRSVHIGHAVWAVLLAVIITTYTLQFSTSLDWLEALLWTGFLLAITYLLGTLIASLVARKLGGLTGDVYGALNEILEVILLLGIVIVISLT